MTRIVHVGERGNSWHTYHVLILHIFSVRAKTNTRARLGSSTLGLQHELYNFHAVLRK